VKSSEPLYIETVESFPAGFGFRMGISHGLATRSRSISVVTRIVSSGGIAGYGESVPREYVTGETPHSVLETCAALSTELRGQTFDSPGAVAAYLRSLSNRGNPADQPAAWCTVDLALLDCAGRHWEMAAADITGLTPVLDELCYSLVLPLLPLDALEQFAAQTAPFGFQAVKVKIDGGDPSERLDIVRRIFGDSVELRVDANCSWSPEDAPAFLHALAERDIVSVEQPFPRDSLEQSAGIRGTTPVLVTFDESVSSPADVSRAAKMKACDIVNVRVSKCGGLTGAAKVRDEALRCGLEVQLGAQVGESCILTAAGAVLASATQEFRWLEGAFGTHLLTEDLCRSEIRFGNGGRFRAPVGMGLGVGPDGELLDNARERALDGE